MKIDLNAEYEFFLSKVGLQKSLMSELQYTEMRRAFFGGMAQLMVLFKSREFMQQTEAEVFGSMDAINAQLMKFWSEESGVPMPETSKYKQVQFTKESALLFQRAYEKADALSLTSFKFEGNEYATGYAKYIVEYLKMQKLL